MAWSVFGQVKQKPAGFVITSKNVQVRPSGGSTPLELLADDFVFPGDIVFTKDEGSADIVICGRNATYALPARGEFTISSDDVHPANGSRLQTSDHASCDLPPITPDLASARRRAFVHPPAPKDRGSEEQSKDLPLGPTYALVVGISEYQKLEEKYWLKFADADAQTFGGFLASPRGGGLAGEDRIKVLINAEATRDAVRNYMRLYLKKAKETHGTFLLVLAAHGFVDDKTREAEILTNESDPQDLSSSGLPMDEIADVLGEGLGGLGRMLIFADVCHAAEIRGIRSNLKRNGVNGAVELTVSQMPGRIFSFVSSKETEPSFEGINWGGGHGAFTYFVLRGLNGEADQNGDGVVSAKELLEYVGEMVKQTTRDEQHPKELTVTVENAASLAQGSKADFPEPFGKYQVLTAEDLSRSRSRHQGPVTPLEPTSQQSSSDEFESAIRAGKLLPGDPQSAYELLGRRFPAGSAAYSLAQTELRVALENKGQEVVLKYLQGDQAEPDRNSFRDAARYFQAAQSLEPDSASVEGRRLFCEGRYAIFGKNYADAIRLLGMAARIDPKGAYSFNALGIAYLEQSNYPLAIAAFNDATRLAPYWVYPRHNLALALAEQGRYDLSIRAYRDTMKLGPDYSYLPYNLGLLYQRLNRLNDAEEAYQLALKIAHTARDGGMRPAAAHQWREGAEILNALGSVEATRPGRKHRENAGKFYRMAINEDDTAGPARHNLALLLSQEAPSTEAEKLWNKVLADNDGEIASRLALARYLSRFGRPDEAILQFKIAIGPDGSFPGIRRELAAEYLKLHKTDEARTVLERALKDSPGSGPILEDLGEVEAKAGNAAKAEEHYRAAEAAYPGSADKSRVRKKLAGKI